MNSTLKKMLSVFLALVMCVSLVPVSALAEDTEAYEDCVSDIPAETEETEEAGHVHQYTFVPKVSPTEENCGTAEHYVCEDCGALFIPEDGAYTEVSAGDLVIPPIEPDEEPLLPAESGQEEDGEIPDESSALNDNVEEQGFCGTGVTYTVYGENNDFALVISGSGAMDDYKDFSGSRPPWYAINYYISSVEIEQGVTHIGNNAFLGCFSVTSFTVSDTVLSSIGEWAFNGCTALTTVNIPDSVTSVGLCAFNGCTGLKDINIGSGVTSIGRDPFKGCSKLENIQVDDANPYYRSEGNCIINKSTNAIIFGCNASVIPSGVTSISEYAFRYFSGLESVVIPSGVTAIGYEAFCNCTGLASVTITGKTISVDESAFEGCNITDVYYGGTEAEWTALSATFGNNNGSLLTASLHCDIDGGTCGDNLIYTLSDDYKLTISGTGEMYNSWDWESNTAPWFGYRASISSVEIGSGVTTLGKNAFRQCSAITSVTVPDSVTFINDYVFQDCSSLQTLSLGAGLAGFDFGVFQGCSALDYVTVAPGNQKYRSESNCVIEKATGTVVLGTNKSVIPEGTPAIGAHAFEYRMGLTGIVIPNSVTSLGKDVFYECRNLSEITLPDSITGIGFGAFGSTGISSIVIPAGVTAIADYTFMNCQNLSTVTIPDSVTSIGDYAFKFCTRLADIYYVGTAEDWTALQANIGTNNEKLTGASVHCTLIAKGQCGASLTWTLTNDYALTISGTGAMYDWQNEDYLPWKQYRSSIKSVTIGSGVTSIGDWAFSRINEASTVVIPENVTSIGKYAFYSCQGMTAVTIPNSVTEIKDDAFNGCVKMETLNLGAGVNSIASSSFRSCEALDTITVAALNQKYSVIGNCLIETAISKVVLGCNSSVIPEGITSIGDCAFRGHGGPEEVTIPSSVTSFGANAFEYCGLVTLKVSEGITEIPPVTFSNCENLRNVYLPFSLTEIGIEAFDKCKGIRDLYYPGTADDWPNVQIGTRNEYLTGTDVTKHFALARGSCGGNLSWILSSDYELSITGTGNMYNWSQDTVPPWRDYHNSIKSVSIGSGVTDIGSYAFADFGNLAEISIPNGVTAIGAQAFTNCDRLVSVSVPDSVVSIGKEAFKDCNGLKTLVIGTGTASIEEDSFYICNALESITVAAGNTKYSSSGNCMIKTDSKTLVLGCKNSVVPSGIESIGNYAFCFCTGISSVNIPDGVQTIGEYAFYSCSGLKYVTVPNTVTSVGERAFAGCSGVSYFLYLGTNDQWTALEPNIGEYNIPLINNVLCCKAHGSCSEDILWALSYDGTFVLYGSGAMPDFANSEDSPWYGYRADCKRAYIGSGITYIGKNAFYACESIESISIPAGVEEIGSCAFYNCRALTEITLPAGLRIVGVSVFNECTALKSVTLPGGLTRLLEDDFKNCSALKDVYFLGTHAQWNSLLDRSTATGNDCLINAALHCAEDFFSVEISHDYLILATGETADISVSAAPDLIKDQLTVESSDPLVATVDASGHVTAVSKGTAYIKASLPIGTETVYAECRVDVCESGTPLKNQVSSVQLITASAKSNVFMTEDLPVISILPVLEQNVSAASLAPEDNDGAAVSAARFALDAAAEYFDLRVKDDRTLEIVPTAKAVADALSGSRDLKGSYSSAVIVTIDGRNYTAGTFKLSVVKTLPSLKCKKVELNSLLTGVPGAIEFTGGTVTSLQPDETAAAKAGKPAVPSFIVLDGAAGTVALSKEDIPAKYPGSNTLFLNAYIKGCAVPVSLKLTVTVKKIVPKLSFSEKSVTLLQGTSDEATVTVNASNAPFNDAVSYPLSFKKLEILDGKTYRQISNNTDLSCTAGRDSETGCRRLLLSAPNLSVDGKAHTYRLTFSCAGTDFTYQIKTLAASARPSFTVKVTGQINTKLPGSPVTLSAVPRNYHSGIGEKYSLMRVEQYKGSALAEYDVKDLFNASVSGSDIILTEKAADSLMTGYTYKAVIGADLNNDGNPECTVTAPLKVTFAKSAPALSLSVKKAGTLDITRPSSSVTLTPALKNWYSSAGYSLVFYMKSGSKSVEIPAGDAPFTVTEAGDVFIIRVKDTQTVATSAYSVSVRATAGGKTLLSKPVTLPITKGRVAVKSNVSSVVMFKNDLYSRATITFSIADTAVAPISNVALDTASASSYSLVKTGYNTYALQYKDSKLPASFSSSTVKLSVFVEGCDVSVGTVSLKVAFK